MTIKLSRALAFVASMSWALLATGQGTNDIAISLDYRGDRLQRIDEAPTLQIYADGRLSMPQTYAHTRSYSSHIEAAELAELLNYIREQGFFDYDNPKRSAARSTTPHIRFAHTTETVLFASDGSRSKRYAIKDLEHVEGAEGLRAIRERLEQLMSVVKLGGKEEANRWLEQANSELMAVHPDAQALSLNDLQSGALRSDGSLSVLFARDAKDAAEAVRVSISVNASGDYASAVSPKPQQ